MKIDAYSLFDELNIIYVTSGKHATAGRLQTKCPYCEGENHLGYHIQREYFNCWKCGWHPLIETLASLSGQSKWEVIQSIERNRTGRIRLSKQKQIIIPKNITLPLGTTNMTEQHIDYLKNRGFSIDRIRQMEKTYNIKGTGKIGEYSFRIIFPITHYGQLVSYQGRDITGISKYKYKACKKEEEIKSHQTCLYGADFVERESVVIVEGILDALRLGAGAIATFGTSMLWPQIKQISERWEKRFIAFDNDKAGEIGAKKLQSILSVMPGKTFIVKYDKHDPGEFTEKEAEDFMKDLDIKG